MSFWSMFCYCVCEKKNIVMLLHAYLGTFIVCRVCVLWCVVFFVVVVDDDDYVTTTSSHNEKIDKNEQITNFSMGMLASCGDGCLPSTTESRLGKRGTNSGRSLSLERSLRSSHLPPYIPHVCMLDTSDKTLMILFVCVTFRVYLLA